MSCDTNDFLSDLLHCSICMNAFQISGMMRPKMLPCQHSFCINCLRGMSAGMSIQCPICRRKFETAVDDLSNNLLLMQIIDSNGPAEPTVDDEPDITEITRSTNESHIENLCKWYKTPSKARAALQGFQQSQQDLEFEAGYLSAILKCMEYYEQIGDSEHHDIVTISLHLIRTSLQKAGAQLLLFPKLTDRVIVGVVAVMNTFKRKAPIQIHSIHILRYIAIPKILGKKIFCAAKVLMQALNIDIGPDEVTKVIETMNVLPRELSREDNAEIGNQTNITNILQILDKKLGCPSYTPTLSSILSALVSLTDETPSTSLNVVCCGGLNILEKLLQAETIGQDPKSNALIVLSNLSEVSEVRNEIIKHRTIIEVLKQLMMSQNQRVSFMSASVIAHLSMVPKREWTHLCGVSDFREDVLQKLYVQVSAWESTSQTNVTFRSFKPLYPLLQMFSSPPTQLFAAWTIRSFCQLDKTSYVEMLIAEEALDILIDIKENRYADPNVRKFVGDIIDSIH